MPTYTFKSNKGDLTSTVVAANETEARKLAMKEIWGPPSGIYKNLGQGLYLIDEVEETP